MKIAILGSVALPVPPVYQGGTEWIAYYQAKGLSQRGHKVILFAAAGSAKENGYELVEVGRGDTIAGSKNGIAGFVESSRNLRKENIYLAQVIQKLLDRKDDYDLILNNMRGEAVFLPIAKMLDKPFVNVMHLPIFPELSEIFKQYQTNIITISSAQRKDFPDLNYLATVGNCVDTEKYVFNPKSEDYLLMMGTIGRHKNQGAAIRVAKKLGMKLVLAGKIRDQDYYNELQKDIDGEIIRHVGEVGFEEKLRFYQNAKAFIFPVLWPEPFGLVMIEAMACGTPVVAFGNGAVPEVVVDGKTGFVIKKEQEEGLVEAVKRINGMSEEEYQLLRKNCRKHVEDHFSVEKMVAAYEKALLKL